MARVLVADDDADVRMLVELKLHSCGHEVTAVGTGGEAVERCREQPPDLVVLDLMMPGMSGLEACAALRSDPALAEMPIILLTARTQDADQVAGRAAGADDYLAKPFSPRELAARVERLLDGRATLPAASAEA